MLSLFPKGLAGLSLFPIPAVILNLFCPDFCSLETVYVRRLVPPVSGTFADPSDGTDRRSDATLGNGGEANSKQPLRSTCLQKQRCWGGGGTWRNGARLLLLTGADAGTRMPELGQPRVGGEEGCKAFPVRGVLFLQRHSLTFGGTRLVGLNGVAVKKRS